MVTDKQVRKLMKLINQERTFAIASAKSGMDEKTARRYKNSGKSPSQLKAFHLWRTRPDPFNDVWEEVKGLLEVNSGLESKTIFEHLQLPGDFSDGQLRTLQRKVKVWRASDGPAKEVYFPQIHYPGVLSESDFTDMSGLWITIEKQPFKHLIYHFVLTYSNWETGTICFSESYESLSEGLQNSLWELGGVPEYHRTDRLSAAVNKIGHPEEFTRHYSHLLAHYGLKGKKIQAGKANENGDVEQRHFRFKKALDQALMLRNSRDFTSRGEYLKFLRDLFKQLNAGRENRFQEELTALKPLPKTRLNDIKKLKAKVRPSSTIRIQNNVYSVHSRLIGENIEVLLHAEKIDLWYAQSHIESIPRIQGDNKFSIQYRHIIDWLIRKPGAFENYRYREELFPTSRFRFAYDSLKKDNPLHAVKEYLKILYLAAKDSESGVDEALRYLLEKEETVSFFKVRETFRKSSMLPPPAEIMVDEINLSAYDELLMSEQGVCHA